MKMWNYFPVYSKHLYFQKCSQISESLWWDLSFYRFWQYAARFGSIAFYYYESKEFSKKLFNSIFVIRNRFVWACCGSWGLHQEIINSHSRYFWADVICVYTRPPIEKFARCTCTLHKYVRAFRNYENYFLNPSPRKILGEKISIPLNGELFR